MVPLTRKQTKRAFDAERREQLIYQRAFDPENYGEDGLGLVRFSHIPVSVIRQLVAEGLLNPQDRRDLSPTVEEMLAFCSGEDEVSEDGACWCWYD